MAGPASSSFPGAPDAFAGVPFFREYLESILRPRVEAALRSVEANLSEHVWRTLLAALKAEDSSADAAALRALVEHQVGLRLVAHLDAEFTDGSVLGHAGGADRREPVIVRRVRTIDNPVAQAMVGALR